MRNTLPVKEKQTRKEGRTYCKEWTVKLCGTFQFPWTWPYRQVEGPSLCRGQQTRWHCRCCCQAGAARILSLLYSWSRRSSAHMLHSGLCFGILSPFSLEIFWWDILAWHLWSTKVKSKNVSWVQHTSKREVFVYRTETVLFPKATGNGWGRKSPSLKENFCSGCPPFFLSYLKLISKKVPPHTHNVKFVWKFHHRQIEKEKPNNHFISASLVSALITVEESRCSFKLTLRHFYGC